MQPSNAAREDQVDFVVRCIVCLFFPALITLLCLGFAIDQFFNGSVPAALILFVFTAMLVALMWWMVLKLRQWSHARKRPNTSQVHANPAGAPKKAAPKAKRNVWRDAGAAAIATVMLLLLFAARAMIKGVSSSDPQPPPRIDLQTKPSIDWSKYGKTGRR
jgi:hypothetical protein